MPRARRRLHRSLFNANSDDKDPNWNEFMPGNKITTPNPLGDSLVAPKTVPRYAKDAAAFPIGAAEPKLDERKRLGFSVLIFLIVYALLLIVAKKKTCSRTEAHVSLDAP
jgi:ubiquinol-cytochrome c reductase cytochrome c1 subunit